MPRKKKTNETEFEVSMTDKDPGGRSSQTTKKVQATSDAEALRKATQGDPRAADYEEVTIKGKGTAAGAKPAGPKPTQPAKPAGVAESKGKKSKGKKSAAKKGRPKKTGPVLDPETMEMVEGLTYPYALMLPGAFKDFLGKMLNETLEVRYGKVYAKIRDAETMARFIESITKSKDRKAKVIREGIMESIS